MLPWILEAAISTRTDDEGDRRLHSLLLSRRTLWFWSWNWDVKARSLLDRQEAELNRFFPHLFHSSSAFVPPSQLVFVLATKRQKLVRKATEKKHFSPLFLKRDLWMTLPWMINNFSSFFYLNMKISVLTCRTEWGRLKVTALTSWTTYASFVTVVFLLSNICSGKQHTHVFLSSYFFGCRVRMAFLIHTDIWQRMVIALLHTERTILVFQCRTLLNLFPHINLSRVLSLPHAHMCPDCD